MASASDGTPVLDLLSEMTTRSIELADPLDARSVMLARIAALVAVDAPTASYLLNLGMAAEVDVSADDIRGVLAAVAPIVGTPRVAAATGRIAEALGIVLEAAESGA